MVTISATRYEVEIQPPSSIPAPIAPWMSGSEAFVIWMFRTAMKAPMIEAPTASQVLSETSSAGATTRIAGRGGGAEAGALRGPASGSLVASMGSVREVLQIGLRAGGHGRLAVSDV